MYARPRRRARHGRRGAAPAQAPVHGGPAASIPSKGMRGQRLNVIKGTVPNPFNMPTGCNFAPRCPYRFEPCPQHDPRVDEGDGPPVACWLWKQAPGYEIPERLRRRRSRCARGAKPADHGEPTSPASETGAAPRSAGSPTRRASERTRRPNRGCQPPSVRRRAAADGRAGTGALGERPSSSSVEERLASTSRSRAASCGARSATSTRSTASASTIRQGRDARPGRRVRLRQDHPRPDAPAAAAARPAGSVDARRRGHLRAQAGDD